MSTSISTLPDLRQRLASRRTVRQADAAPRRAQAEEFNRQGDTLCANAKWEEAIACYELAITTYGPRAAYMNNLAAAYLKVGRYIEAERAATMALQRDSKLVEATYRKGLALHQQNKYRSAVTQLQKALQLSPTSDEIQQQLNLSSELLRQMPQSDDDEEIEYADLNQVQSGTKTPVLSDSEDYNHIGNGYVCQPYNHKGCTRGTKCKLKHAPDDHSLRDDAGRNVCLSLMLGLCAKKSKCCYTHDKGHIPRAPATWGNREWVATSRALVTFAKAHESAVNSEKMAMILRGPSTREGYLPSSDSGPWMTFRDVFVNDEYYQEFLRGSASELDNRAGTSSRTAGAGNNKEKTSNNGGTRGEGTEAGASASNRKGKAKRKKQGKAKTADVDLSDGFAQYYDIDDRSRWNGLTPWDDEAPGELRMLAPDWYSLDDFPYGKDY